MLNKLLSSLCLMGHMDNIHQSLTLYPIKPIFIYHCIPSGASKPPWKKSQLDRLSTHEFKLKFYDIFLTTFCSQAIK